MVYGIFFKKKVGFEVFRGLRSKRLRTLTLIILDFTSENMISALFEED